jgi:hypothetical protein
MNSLTPPVRPGKPGGRDKAKIVKVLTFVKEFVMTEEEKRQFLLTKKPERTDSTYDG